MNGDAFLRLITAAYVPFLRNLGFSMRSPSMSGRRYNATFVGAKHQVIVSFEPGDDFVLVAVQHRDHLGISDFDDTLKTPRLANLNEQFMGRVSNEERANNETHFSSISACDDQERRLLKSAKELRLVLPKYLSQ